MDEDFYILKMWLIEISTLGRDKSTASNNERNFVTASQR